MQGVQLALRRLAGNSLALTQQLRPAACALTTSCSSFQALPALAEETGGGWGCDQPLHRALLLDAAGTLLSPSEPAAEVHPPPPAGEPWSCVEEGATVRCEL